RGAREKAPPPAVAPAWAYEGPGGPSAWGTLQPAYTLCGIGREQSPIDIRDGLAVDLEPVHFNYQPGHFAVLDTGRTVQVKVAPGDRIEVAGRPYQLESLDFHHPAEERIDGRGFPMSVHLVHRDADGRVAVVALLVEPGEPQPVVQQVWNNLPLDRDDPQPARELLDPTRLLPVDRRYATYLGSLTQPPCTEGVRWIVMRQPITLSPEQIALFARLYPMNARPLQPARARRILQSR
ncbi:MAG: carbonic anhydrase family protein, partial [Burkholderiales bacterium]|nr:carbonic anhydrase family protein [Burkholderiales bacterium]